MRLFSSIVAIHLFALGGAAHAALITIEPDDYALGSVIGPTPHAAFSFMSHVYGDPDWTFRSARAGLGDSCDLYSSCGASTGSQVFWDGQYYGGEPSYYGTSDFGVWVPFIVQPPGTTIADRATFNAFRVDFATPTDFFSADMVGVSDFPYYMTFAADGSVLSTGYGHMEDIARPFGPGCVSNVSGRCRAFDQSVTVQHASADIAFILIGSNAAAAVDAIRFNVPEPSSTALMALGLVVMLGAARKGRRTVVDTLRLAH